MGSYIVQQPNGLFCRFSSFCDCPTDWNMTKEDYISLCMERAKQDAIDTLENHLQPFERIQEDFNPTNMRKVEFDLAIKEMHKRKELVRRKSLK